MEKVPSAKVEPKRKVVFLGGLACISLLFWFLSLFTCFNQVDECFFVGKPFVAKAHAHCGAALSCWH